MKKIILIICLLPIFAFSQVSYKIIADSTILKSISTNSNELVIRNSTKDTTTSVLYNNGNGVTQFKKVRVIGLNDSTYVVKIGTLVVGDTIKIHGQQSLGGTVTSVATDVTLTGGPIISSGTLKVDTTIISTKNYALNIGNNKATFSALNDSITAVRSIRKVDTIYKNTGGDSIVYTINGLRRAIIDRQNTGTVTSIATGVGLSGGTITGSGTIVADTSGTLVTKTFLTSSLSGIGGGASLSSLTAATATNNILNTNYKQRWNWNTIAGDTALAILSTSTGAASNLQNLFTVALSGANATSSQTTYAANFSNTHTGTSSTNYAIRLSASGATNNYGLTSDADLLINGITAGKGKWQGTNSSYNTAFGYNALNSAGSGCIVNTAFGRDALSTITNSIQNTAVGSGAMGFATSYANCVGVGYNALNASTGSQNTAVGSVALTNQTSGTGNTSIGSAAGEKLNTGSYNTFLGASTLGGGSNRGLTECTLVGAFSGFQLTGNTTTAVGYGTLYAKTSGANCVALGYKAGYDVTTAANSVYIGNSLATSHATKNNIILLSDGSGNERVMIESDGRVGIGTTSPAASAVLDLTSTTQGFLPPRMTTTQRDAISSPATGLMIYDTTVNKVSVYNGSIWKYLQYE